LGRVLGLMLSGAQEQVRIVVSVSSWLPLF
jgi:hypothetical protein